MHAAHVPPCLAGAVDTLCVDQRELQTTAAPEACHVVCDTYTLVWIHWCCEWPKHTTCYWSSLTACSGLLWELMVQQYTCCATPIRSQAMIRCPHEVARQQCLQPKSTGGRMRCDDRVSKGDYSSVLTLIMLLALHLDASVMHCVTTSCLQSTCMHEQQPCQAHHVASIIRTPHLELCKTLGLSRLCRYNFLTQLQHSGGRSPKNSQYSELPQKSTQSCRCMHGPT